MDKHRLRGKGKQIKGAVNEAVGKLAGDRSTELKGKGQQMGGKAEAAYGRVKDEMRAALQQARERNVRRSDD